MTQVTLTTLGTCIDLVGPLYSEHANWGLLLFCIDQGVQFFPSQVLDV